MNMTPAKVNKPHAKLKQATAKIVKTHVKPKQTPALIKY